MLQRSNATRFHLCRVTVLQATYLCWMPHYTGRADIALHIGGELWTRSDSSVSVRYTGTLLCNYLSGPGFHVRKPTFPEDVRLTFRDGRLAQPVQSVQVRWISSTSSHQMKLFEQFTSDESGESIQVRWNGWMSSMSSISLAAAFTTAESAAVTSATAVVPESHSSHFSWALVSRVTSLSHHPPVDSSVVPSLGPSPSLWSCIHNRRHERFAHAANLRWQISD